MSEPNGVAIFCYYMTKTEYDVLLSMKLTYFTYAVYAQVENKPLFKNEIYAWISGPVIKDAYDSFGKRLIKLENQFKKREITEEERTTQFLKIAGEMRTAKKPVFENNFERNNKSLVYFCDSVFQEVLYRLEMNKSRGTTAWKAQNLFCGPGSPWERVYIFNQKIELTFDIIKDDPQASEVKDNVEYILKRKMESLQERKEMAERLRNSELKMLPVTSVWN